MINPRLAFDMANIKTGWILFSKGMGPISAWDKDGQMAAKPEGDYRRGFYVLVCGNDSLPGIGPLGLREFTSTAGVVITPILKMYEEYEAQMTAHPNAVPFYTCTGITSVSGVHGTNYEPAFRLTGWVDRVKLPAFDEHLRTAASSVRLPAHENGPLPNGSPSGAQQDMPDGRPVHPAPDPNAPQGRGDLNDEIPW